MTDPQPTYVVSVGNPYDGITLYGPFQDHDDADHFAGSVDTDWHIIELHRPEDA